MDLCKSEQGRSNCEVCRKYHYKAAETSSHIEHIQLGVIVKKFYKLTIRPST